jgi:hypothetical protein
LAKICDFLNTNVMINFLRKKSAVCVEIANFCQF